MKLRIFDYENNGYDTPYDIEDIDYIGVVILSGDELLEVHMKNGRVFNLDAATFSGQHRSQSYFDDSMVLVNSQLEKWNQRKHARVWYKEWDDDEG